MYDSKFMHELMTSAGKLALKYFGNVKPTWKENQTYVTDADIAVQEYVRTALEREFPDDGMIGEEEALLKTPRCGERYWVIDPIDGTASFAHGFPIWGVAIGLLEGSQALGGFFYMPTSQDYFYTQTDGGVWHNERRKHLKTPDFTNREAVLLTGARFHRRFSMQPEYAGKTRSLGATVAHLCYVAIGSADAAMIQRVALWDLVAGVAMLAQNGGVLEYIDGRPVDLAELLVNNRAPKSMFAGHPDVVKQYRQWLIHEDVQ